MALGPLWIVLQPVINMILFSFVFGTIAKLPSEGVPYPIFVYTALLPWTLFQNACTFLQQLAGPADAGDIQSQFSEADRPDRFDTIVGRRLRDLFLLPASCCC